MTKILQFLKRDYRTTYPDNLYQIKTIKHIGKNTYFETWYMTDYDLVDVFGLYDHVDYLIGRDLELTTEKAIEFKKIR